MAKAAPRPPSHLSADAKKLWRDVVGEWALEAPALRILGAACEAFDRMNDARRELAEHGTTYVDRFGSPRKHPAVSIEEAARVAFLRAMRELNLEPESASSRPPRTRGRY